MRRRSVLALLAAAASSPSVTVRVAGEPTKVFRLGVLQLLPPGPGYRAFALQNERKLRVGYLTPGKGPDTPFVDELASLGYAEGRNLEVLFKGFGDDPGRIQEFAAALVRTPVEVIVARGPEAAVRAVRAATDTIPIVMIAINYDPIERGYAMSLAHPGGNVTGVFFRSLELAAKQGRGMKPHRRRGSTVDEAGR